jgi:hypothetical protein
MPAYIFYPRLANGVSLTFVAQAAKNDADAMEMAADIAADHDCVGVFVWEPASTPEGLDRFVGEVGSLTDASRKSGDRGASATA